MPRTVDGLLPRLAPMDRLVDETLNWLEDFDLAQQPDVERKSRELLLDTVAWKLPFMPSHLRAAGARWRGRSRRVPGIKYWRSITA